MLKKIVLVFVGFLATMPTLVRAIDLREYLFVDTSRQQAEVSGQFDFKSGNQEQASFNGTVRSSYAVTYSTLPFAWKLDFSGQAAISRNGTNDAETEKEYTLRAQTSADKYFPGFTFLNRHDFLGFGALDLGYRKSKSDEKAEDPYVKAEIGIGLGRIIDATDLAKATRLIDDLQQYGVINRELSQQGYFDLAEIIGAENTFKKEYRLDEYQKYWFETIETVLQQNGVLTSGALGALGMIRLQEVLINLPFSTNRSHGHLSKIGIGYIISNYADSDAAVPTLDLSYAYALPFSTYQWQFADRVGYSLTVSNFSHQFTNALSATYAVSLQIDWENTWNLTYTIPDQGNNTLANELTSVLKY